MADLPIRVPPGHQVAVYSASAEPGIARTSGGVVLANLGGAGDDPDTELASVASSVCAATLGDPSPTLLVSGTAPVAVAELFAPAEPHVRRLSSPVV